MSFNKQPVSDIFQVALACRNGLGNLEECLFFPNLEIQGWKDYNNNKNNQSWGILSLLFPSEMQKEMGMKKIEKKAQISGWSFWLSVLDESPIAESVFCFHELGSLHKIAAS